MTHGFLLERGDHDVPSVTHWISGNPEPSLWSGLKLKGRQNLPCVTFRCSSCGFLETYGLEPGTF